MDTEPTSHWNSQPMYCSESTLSVSVTSGRSPNVALMFVSPCTTSVQVVPSGWSQPSQPSNGWNSSGSASRVSGVSYLYVPEHGCESQVTVPPAFEVTSTWNSRSVKIAVMSRFSVSSNVHVSPVQSMPFQSSVAASALYCASSVTVSPCGNVQVSRHSVPLTRIVPLPSPPLRIRTGSRGRSPNAAVTVVSCVTSSVQVGSPAGAHPPVQPANGWNLA